MFSLAFAAPGSLTGYGFTYGLRPEFSSAYDFNDTEEIGSLDAPRVIAAGGFRSGEFSPVQLFARREGEF